MKMKSENTCFENEIRKHVGENSVFSLVTSSREKQEHDERPQKNKKKERFIFSFP
jgi:hypothetical protein